VSEPGTAESNWASLNEHAGLGLPAGRGERHRLTRRVVARLGGPLVRHQVEYNRELLVELVSVRDSLVAQTAALGEAATAQLVALSGRLGELLARLDVVEGGFESRTAGIVERVEAQEARFDELCRRFDELCRRYDELCQRYEEDSVDRGLVHEEVELAQRHAHEIVREACDAFQDELREIADRAGTDLPPPATAADGDARL